MRLTVPAAGAGELTAAAGVDATAAEAVGVEAAGELVEGAALDGPVVAAL